MSSVIIILVLLDQQTKAFARYFLADRSYPFLTLVYNDGIAYGLFSGKVPVTIVLNLLILIGLIIFRKKIFGSHLLQKLSFVFIISGGIGNTLDRILQGHVVDFFDIKIIPVFNFADIYLNIGILLLFLTTLLWKTSSSHKQTIND